jgi:hypothetical protein
MKLILNRGVLRAECHWLDDNMAEGTIVHPYVGHTYGCVGEGFAAVSMVLNETPFITVPKDALTPLQYAFRGRVCDSRGYALAVSEPCISRRKAARAVLLMRPRAKSCSTSYCDPEGNDAHHHIIWHDREDVFKPSALDDH